MNKNIQIQVREYAESKSCTVEEAMEKLLTVGLNRVKALKRHARNVELIPAFNVPYTTRAELAIEQSTGDEFEVEVA